MLAPGLLALLLLGGVPHGTTSSGKAAPSSRSASTGSAPSPVRPSGGLTLLLELGGHPAGTVTLSLHGRDYRYVSRHLFAVGASQAERVREGRYTVDADGRTSSGAIPAALWLWRRPAAGCVRGLEELDDVEGRLCAQDRPDGALTGDLRGVAFTARYGTDGQLSELSLPGARLRRLGSGERVRASRSLLDRLAGGLALPEGDGALAWIGEPIVDGRGNSKALSAWREDAARRLSREVDRSFTDKRQGPADFDPDRAQDVRGACLAHARRFVARAGALGQRTQVVHGLVAHEGALRPHAWVQVGLAEGATLELDPALGVPVRPTTHLALGAEAGNQGGVGLGEAWLEVLDGRRRVTRACAGDARRVEGAVGGTGERASRAVCVR